MRVLTKRCPAAFTHDDFLILTGRFFLGGPSLGKTFMTVELQKVTKAFAGHRGFQINLPVPLARRIKGLGHSAKDTLKLCYHRQLWM